MLIDTHLHLDAPEFDPDRAAVVARACAAGVTRFVLPAVEIANGPTVRALAASLPGSAFACGIHPLYVDRALESDIARLGAQLAEGGAVAVGEIGLDGFEAEPDPARREWFFAEQLKLAREFDLPVILHIRRAQDRVLKYLRRHRVRGGIAHAFNGSLQQAQTFIELGFRLGFGGAMTYAGSTRIRQLAASLPLEALVLESDAPDIPPAWAAQARNEPAAVARFATELAALRGLDVASVVRVTSANARAALGLPE
ncbi:TatD family hydrolase [Uliginosibacterium aquaticum]|uniref:TatD family hydrolase n=1 Tax=Uliginosibacterium aquaticum TaxID=2731212 RepID=A0ABX2IIG8_9RHOO|nr:TatD family hydrolase [Uliginosibacterium aquaticum]NSL56571.1 TatD family hydrolase [Uliginosibacterium aquaticum]